MKKPTPVALSEVRPFPTGGPTAYGPAYPEADHIQVLYAEALMNMTPWDYWEAGGSTPRGRTAEIVATLERVLARSLDHAGAIHYYIHMVEASDRPERALPYARRLEQVRAGDPQTLDLARL